MTPMTPMVVQCTSCLTEFELDPHKVPSSGVRARCSVCSAVIAVPPPPAGRSEAASPSGYGSSAQTGGGSAQTMAAPATERTPTTDDLAPSARAAAPATAPAQQSGASASDAAQVTPPGGVSRRPINPFLSRDPALRAKRLARALVSDIVAYHPARHAEGLRDGTLKTLFRDEIKKSYDEYVDQVGREFASSTTHFQDALNDVLAGGKKLF
jgi:predicted Zn finger-like uncharacterized protein